MNNIIGRLKEALGECKRINTSVCLTKTSYEVISERFFFIADDKDYEPEEPVKIVGNNDNYQLRVQNKDQKDICLIKTDNCLFGDDHQKSDCILFSNDTFYIVEISDSSSGQRNRKRNNAVDQLGNTIQILLEKNFNLENFSSKAIICFKSGKTKPVQSSFNTQRLIFMNKYKVSLEEGNFISF